MNRLPQVLQNEIWEYVHGDRAYWKQQFRPIIQDLDKSGIFDTPWHPDYPHMVVGYSAKGEYRVRSILGHHGTELTRIRIYPWVHKKDCQHRTDELSARLKREFPLLFF